MIFTSKLPSEVMKSVMATSDGIVNSGHKLRDRSAEEVFKHTLNGKCIEHAASEIFGLKFNQMPEDKLVPESYDHDLFDPYTGAKYEVKTAFTKVSGKFGNTLNFHESIRKIANDGIRNFQYFIFGEVLHFDDFDATYKVKIHAVIHRDLIKKFSHKSYLDNYVYFRDGLAYNSSQYYKLYYKGV